MVPSKDVINRGQEDPANKHATSIGLNLSKNSFQNHGVDEAGKMTMRQSLRQRQVMPFFRMVAPLLISMDVCGTSRFMVREQWALSQEVKLMLKTLVKAQIRRAETANMISAGFVSGFR